MSAEVDVLIEDPRWATLDLTGLAPKCVSGTLDRLGFEPSVFEVSLLAADDSRIADLNEAFRNKPQPTNVLSWPSQTLSTSRPGEAPMSPEIPAAGLIELGDIALAYDTCHREAIEMDKPFAEHVSHLLVHATLHLLGYDHLTDADAELMEGLETEILAQFGIADPYRS
ncbi:rRNA maturation RNase YbeY [Pseudaestuariivita rosea]|uniref:rRNA maturation RNase YbeY n=1 Tax=Pseudaestuariivita rosea TaxID=2763263 RepID=UPI001ABBC4C5|nr:rRNA maturation RNase YbeY [Pseudaestuariivita rosea]